MKICDSLQDIIEISAFEGFGLIDSGEYAGDGFSGLFSPLL